MKKLSGAIPAIITPFKKDKSIDIEALRKFVSFQVKNGVDAIVACGSTGEAATLNIDEMSLVIKTVVETVNGKIPVIGGAGSNNTERAIELSQIAKDAGADVLLHVTPFYNKPTPKGLIAHFKAIADATDMPIILYNVPGRTGSNVTASTLLAIAKEVSQVVAVKEASGDVEQVMEIIKGKAKDFTVLSGDDAITLPLMSIGAAGCISVACNEIPKEFSQMTKLALEGNWEKAKKIHYELLDLMHVNFIESNPIPVKTALFLMGKIQESFRLPLTTITDKNRDVLISVLKKQGLIK